MLNKLEKALGYKFRDPELLRMALTHTSCANKIYQEQYVTERSRMCT